MADFEEKNVEMIEAARAAREPAAEGLEAFAVAFRAVGQTCRACHTDYRAEKN
jgi:cytochrome c556